MPFGTRRLTLGHARSALCRMRVKLGVVLLGLRPSLRWLHCVALHHDEGVMGFGLLLHHYPNPKIQPLLQAAEKGSLLLHHIADGIQVVGQNACDWLIGRQPHA